METGGHPAEARASTLAAPILASDGFCQEGKRGSLLHFDYGTMDVLLVREGVSVAGVEGGGGRWVRNKAKGPSSEGRQPLGLGRC